MADLPYMQFYPAKYLADTAHLTTLEHGAYLLLIFNYWQRDKPLQDINTRLSSVARVSKTEWETVRPALEEYFDIRDGFWYHNRLESDLQGVKDKISKKKKAGLASAEAKKNTCSTPVQQKVNKRSTKRREENRIEKKRIEKNTKEKDIFDLARKSFKGIKNGLDVEYDNLLKVCKTHNLNPTDIVGLLYPAIEREIAHKKILKKSKDGFCPSWKNFQTWINQRCWTQEFEGTESNAPAPRRRCKKCNTDEWTSMGDNGLCGNCNNPMAVLLA
jgi:uncharacterized protein YdaU (DUF1376 family)